MSVYVGGSRVSSGAGAVYVGGRRSPHEQYQRILDILGPTGLIIPIGDSEHENPVLAQVETVGESRRKFTYSEPVSAWDTPPYLMGPGRIPIVTFNGIDEDADSPADPYWSRGDGINDNPFSVGAWVNMTNLAVAQTTLSKYQGAGSREWLHRIMGDEKLNVIHFDENDSTKFPQRASTAPIGVGVWRLLVAAYDGGAVGMSGVTLYNNGVVEASTRVNDGTYTAMSDTAGKVAIGRWANSADRFGSKMAGGALGPFYAQRELSSTDISDLYDVGRALLGA